MTSAVAVFSLAIPLAAQVGHDPAKSPYRDLRYGQFVWAGAGYFRGDGGQAGVGPHNGMVYSLRHEFLADRTVSVILGVSYAPLERRIGDPLATSGPRIRGPLSQKVTFAEGTIQFNITGGKTWHGVAPYVAMGTGLAFGATQPSDSSGFKFRTKLFVAPSLGARLFLSRRLFLRLEARNVFWNLSYPDVYRRDPDGLGPLLPLVSTRKEWLPSGWYQVGLGYPFRRPFF